MIATTTAGDLKQLQLGASKPQPEAPNAASVREWPFLGSLSPEQPSSARYPLHVMRGDLRTGCGIPDAVIGLGHCRRRDESAGDPVAVCCLRGCSNALVASGVLGSGGRPPRPLALNELAGLPPRAAHATRNW